ncbi:phenylalanine--tRNA ligase beta subunit-related protein [Actinoplanes sp. NPDC048791]|uniref:B3/B4 domain-containing protein n=1 Tax=Actinoplanes sp. NPDC048791 TaxID=3154623 RepID=UPI0033C51DD0
MRFQHHDDVWREFPALAAGALLVTAVPTAAHAAEVVAHQLMVARERLAAGPEGQFPEIQAWRRAFTALGVKATQYRCASESLLRRLRRDGELPTVHPLVDVCNAMSAASAIPVAALDVARIDGDLEVRHATGNETYLTFGGEKEHPVPGEVTFADTAGNAHARRWTNRQSGLSAVTADTTTALIVAEALHEGAAADIARLTAALADALGAERVSVLTRDAPGFTI